MRGFYRPSQRDGLRMRRFSSAIDAGVGTSDIYFGSVSSLLHFDGIDTSTTFTDEKGFSWTATGNAQIDTSESVFGGSSALFDGSGDYITSPNSSAFAFGTDDFTIEFFLRLTSTSGQRNIFEINTTLGTNPTGRMVFYFGATSANLRFYSSLDRITANTPITLNTWTHVALCRFLGTSMMFIGGTKQTGIYVDSINYNQQVVRIGGDGSSYLPGSVDEFRITKGLARYTASFTPPTKAFPSY